MADLIVSSLVDTFMQTTTAAQMRSVAAAAAAADLADYLPLTGGTLSGPLSGTTVAASAGLFAGSTNVVPTADVTGLFLGTFASPFGGAGPATIYKDAAGGATTSFFMAHYAAGSGYNLEFNSIDGTTGQNAYVVQGSTAGVTGQFWYAGTTTALTLNTNNLVLSAGRRFTALEAGSAANPSYHFAESGAGSNQGMYQVSSTAIGFSGAGSELMRLTHGTGMSVTGSITASTQLISSVATGTAPLVVASTTNVPNLNASSLSGATFAAPGAIGGTTPAAGTFTTLVAGSTTSLLVGTAGSAVGNIGFRNATSGTITLAPPTGALGTVTVTLPASGTLFSSATLTDVLQAGTFAADAGGSDTYAITLAPAITAYVTGAHYRFKANTANTGAATLNINGLGAKTIVKVSGGITTALATNDILAGQWVDLVYDGTNLQMQSTLGNAPSGSGTVASGTINKVAKYTAGTTVGDSLITDDGTTMTYAGTGGITSAGTATGVLTATGATSGALKLTGVDAMAQIVTINLAAQTSGAATITILDQAGVSRNILTAGTLTATRVPFVSANGVLTDDADMTFVTDTLTVAKAVLSGTTSLLLGTAGSAVGNIGFRNATSGTATLAPPTGALGTYTVTLPNAASTMPIFGQQITFAGPTQARTITLPDAAFTVARTDASQTLNGAQILAEGASVQLDPAGSADGAWSGISVTGTSGYSQAFGDVVMLDPNQSPARWELASVSAAVGAVGDCRGNLAMVVVTGTDGNSCTLLRRGNVRADANFPALTVNGVVYATTTGDITQTQPTTTDHVIRILGQAITADEIYFDPDNIWTTHT